MNDQQEPVKNNEPHEHANDHAGLNQTPSPVNNAFWGAVLVVLTVLLAVVIWLAIGVFRKSVPDIPDNPDNPSGPSDPDNPDNPDDPNHPSTPDQPDNPGQMYLVAKSAATQEIPVKDTKINGVYSKYAVLVNLSNMEMVAELNADEVIYPASMTKVMTLLVACETLTEEQLDSYVTMSGDIITYMQQQDASGAGLEANEELKVRDLLYAIALESDCAASMQIAEFVAGSESAFVDMMNKKATDMGLIKTHFVNSHGLHDAEHVTTCREMASIMAAAMKNPLVKTLLSTESYECKTNIYTKRRSFYNTFFCDVVKPVRDAGFAVFPSNGKVIAAKTGMTDEAGCCLATYFESSVGNTYVMISAKASTSYMYVQDYLYVYETYAK